MPLRAAAGSITLAACWVIGAALLGGHPYVVRYTSVPSASASVQPPPVGDSSGNANVGATIPSVPGVNAAPR